MTSLSGLLVVGLMLLVYARAEDKSYSIELSSFENGNIDWADWGTLRIRHVGRNKYTLDRNIEFERNIGDEQSMWRHVFGYEEDTKQIGSLIKVPFCQFVNEKFILQKKSNMIEQGDCPFSKDKYTIDNYELETTFLPPTMPMGDYLLVLNITDKDDNVSGHLASVTLTQ
ncbi:uncharacterized protein CheA7a [Drosophila virilis]|uniref:MD-2-related lipid-recognition domain-containing protein n=1 Tax=Drosophila virilis TaxID=7244 RepID=B4M3G2_DROVI|nr:uncharacterized protein LOC6631633 [Drosophila virilis]EDW65337.1 uncharacterized protein Dvir_GJ19207 [Drosophila virilis]